MSFNYILLGNFVKIKELFKSIQVLETTCPGIVFIYFRRLGAYWPLSTPTTIPCPCPPPANSRHTKQFLSRPHGL
jgi:hypothetical protein